MFSSVTGDVSHVLPVSGMMPNYAQQPGGLAQLIGGPAGRPTTGNQLPGYIQPLNDPMPRSMPMPMPIPAQPVAGPVAPMQQPNQPVDQYRPYFQQMRQNIAGLDRSLQQFEQNMLPGQQGYGMGNRLGMF